MEGREATDHNFRKDGGDIAACSGKHVTTAHVDVTGTGNHTGDSRTPTGTGEGGLT